VSTISTSAYPNPKYGWYVVIVLTLNYINSYIDRQFINLVVEPIKADFVLSDTQVSLLMGFAFGIFYAIMGIPLGRLADRHNRVWVMTIGVAFWSCMTVSCGLARNYIQLFLARIGIGVGEAALSPAALSVISDYFPKEKRTLPLGFYNMGIYIGSGLAMILGGFLLNYIQDLPNLVIPIVGELRSWQLAFIIIGLPGFLLALMLLTIKEPYRQEAIRRDDTDSQKPTSIPFKFVLTYLFKRWQTYGAIFVGVGFMSIGNYANLSWIPTMLYRTHDIGLNNVGFVYGTIVLITGPVGIIVGGWFGSRLYNKGHKNGLMRGAVVGSLMLAPSTFLYPLMPTVELTVFFLVFASLGTPFITACIVPALLIITPNQLRGTTYALFLFAMSIVGLLLGPTIVALVTDYFFHDESMLYYSLSIVTGATSLFIVLFFSLSLPYYRTSMTEMETLDKNSKEINAVPATGAI